MEDYNTTTPCAVQNATVGATGEYFTTRNIWKTNQLWENWLKIVIVSGTTLILSCYILIVLSIDLCTGTMIKTECREKTAKKLGTCMKAARFMLTICVMINCPIIEKILVDIYVPSICRQIRVMRGTGGSFSSTFAYAAMWFRQRSIYANPALQHLTNPCTRILSIAVAVLVVASPLSTYLIYVTAYSFGVVDSGCAIIHSTFPAHVVWIMNGTISLLMQGILLSLFVLPLYKHYTTMKKGAMIENNKATPNRNLNRDLNPVIKRALLTSTGCAVTDVIGSSMAASSVLNDGITLPLFMQLSLFVNLIMVILSFPEWKRTIFPWHYRNQSTISNVERGENIQTIAETHIKITTIINMPTLVKNS